MQRPTFDQIAYTPDLEECLTLEQATALIDRLSSQLEPLTKRILDEIAARRFSVPEKSVNVYTAETLVRHTHRAKFPDRMLVAHVSFFASGGSPMPITVRYWFETEALEVGWGHLLPTPGWQYGVQMDVRSLPVPILNR